MRITHRGELRNKLTEETIIRASIQSEEVKEVFQTLRQEWEVSGPCEQLRSTLASVKMPIEISKIIGLACSTMAYSDSKATPRSAFQHALLLTLQDVLGKKEGNPENISCYAQDPCYTDSDKSVLEAAGIRVLEHPEAFLEIDDSSVVISSCPNVPVRQIVSDLARPALMIWDRIREKDSVKLL
jgi:SRR1